MWEVKDQNLIPIKYLAVTKPDCFLRIHLHVLLLIEHVRNGCDSECYRPVVVAAVFKVD